MAIVKPELKRIEWVKGFFEANGKTYFISDQLSVDRYEVYESLSYEVSFDESFQTVAKTLRELCEILTSGNDVLGSIHKAYETAFNQLSALKRFGDDRTPSVLWFCTLFINRANEDLKVWDKRVATEKIKDWKEEGIDMRDFFLFATNAIAGFKEAYQWLAEKEEDEKETEIQTPKS